MRGAKFIQREERRPNPDCCIFIVGNKIFQHNISFHIQLKIRIISYYWQQNISTQYSISHSKYLPTGNRNYNTINIIKIKTSKLATKYEIQILYKVKSKQNN